MTIVEVFSAKSETERRSNFRQMVVLDVAERAIVVVLFSWLVTRLLMGFYTTGNTANLLLLPSEGLVVFFVLTRRWTIDVSRNPLDWILASTATCTPLLIWSQSSLTLVSPQIGAAIIVAGIIIQVSAKLILGRSFGCIPANRGIKESGPYRYVRHPMYTGYLVSHVGFLLLNPCWWNLSIYAMAYATQIPRLLAEERLLKLDSKYANYMGNVRYRLIPGVF